ncbi:vomeronasal type-1 receptor 4 [Mus musculus]|jgi:vomeronasal1 receptor|uniref:Vomeronasal type-1 receptor n=3 Tax=Mus musculus TaxID=10090 RepID=Q8R296_MOUSE|nr:vomeronasal type-1 receptor 4 [Mus musculus]AEF00429.1 vomeronasal type 1 receptor F3 [Mus musculus musculus]AEF00431.1 vomeronasal type 1 receptor F3 [Mus musculus domesticus]AAI25544.1 Vomeronasal 1 receptor, F3 [Mus musculus]AAI38067.1 Vomeronasal 1 receptor, F3 [Mus musculus]AAL47919.1 vomeronasal receptor V1RF3 [Mus musculus]|eukprot:NP_598961.1 vomeronasal type-1 receptor 4 [Mus musculus]
MENSDIVISVIFLSQTVVGILGNSFLVYHYLMLYYMRCRLKFTDWILQHLIVANFLTLLCKGIPHTVSAFGLKNFLDDIGCKLTFYLHRIGRGVSISSTCFLSVFQAITISPSASRWTQLKAKSPSYIASCVYMSWALSFLVNIAFPMDMRARQNNRNITRLRVYGICSTVHHNKVSDIINAVLLSIPDVVFMVLMVWSSGYMVCILYRHKQRMKHIHRSTFSFRSSAEFRATKTILLLVSTFVFFYTISCLFQINLALFHNPTSLWVNMASVVTACFPTVSPFLVISS